MTGRFPLTSKRDPAVKRVALVGNCIPRRCGIATFTYDLCRALTNAGRAEIFIAPVNDVPEGYDYPDPVWFEISEKKLDSYRQAADFLNLHDVDVVCLQHEFGIFGGPAGRHVLALLRGLSMPVVATLHTVLADPTNDQREVMKGLVDVVDRFVMLSERGGELLREVYDVPSQQVEVIPHGIPSMAFVDPSFYKDKFGVAGRHVLLTFGLIGPGKGIEQAIEAMPRIVERHPEALYLIVGATHPHLLRDQGEVYRIGLQRLARQLGVEKNVIFHNRFVSDAELDEFIGAAEIYLTPYLSKAQICSGTLARAVGAGKAVVSTPYWHAEELLADERGVLVPFDDPGAISDAVNDLLDNEVQRDAMRKRAFLSGRAMTWSAVALEYLDLFERCRLAPRKRTPVVAREHRGETLPVINLAHLRRMTDGTGMLQHSTHAVPNYDEGYSTDDNARALILVLMLDDVMNSATDELVGLASRYMSFLQYAFNPECGRFRNFLAYDHRHWLEDVGSEDSHGRSLWALGTLIDRCSKQTTREWAIRHFDAALPVVEGFTSPRAWAFSMIGIAEYLKRLPGHRTAQRTLRDLADRLMSLYRASSDTDWQWFEEYVTYCNAKLPHALLVAASCLDDEDMREVALSTLTWLCRVQTSDIGHFLPIGCDGFYPRGGERAVYDQQPIEAHATISATMAAHRATGAAMWLDEARRAFDWFLGGNDLGRPVCDPTTGGCHDGVHRGAVNANQGAESTLAFLMSRIEIRVADYETLRSGPAAGEVEIVIQPGSATEARSKDVPSASR
ncbi:MAG: glycosyltransferase [Planctomycetes bacterium]|nr:glycosyltransferase [Planctomycetota bacterium]